MLAGGGRGGRCHAAPPGPMVVPTWSASSGYRLPAGRSLPASAHATWTVAAKSGATGRKVHKTEHHDRERIIYVGPKAQQVLLPYLLRDAQANCFSPAESEAKTPRGTTGTADGPAYSHRSGTAGRPGRNARRRRATPRTLQPGDHPGRRQGQRAAEGRGRRHGYRANAPAALAP